MVEKSNFCGHILVSQHVMIFTDAVNLSEFNLNEMNKFTLANILQFSVIIVENWSDNLKN